MVYIIQYRYTYMHVDYKFFGDESFFERFSGECLTNRLLELKSRFMQPIAVFNVKCKSLNL